MPYVERTDEEIIAAWQRWVDELADADVVILHYGNQAFGPKEFVARLRNGDPVCRTYGIDAVRDFAKLENGDPLNAIARQ